jgi:hypothetical protein
MKTGITILALLFAMMTVTFAQSPTPNIATSAVCTHSSGGSGAYGPQEYNSGVIAAQNSLPWGWTSGGTHTNSSAWIMFEWTTPQTFGEFTFYYGGINTRYLLGAHIQYWNGSSWITGHTFLFSAPYTIWQRSVQFAPITSTRVRITNWTMAPIGQTSNPNFREIEIRNVCTDPSTLVSFSTNPTTVKPDGISINYLLSRPYGVFDATLTFQFYTPTNVLVHSESIVVPYNGTPISGTHVIQSSILPVGFYRIEVTFNVMGICNTLENVIVNQVVMVINEGTTPCIVYPGDVNNDGVCNYGDRKSLNKYIFDANLRSTWLTGPARYRADVAANPLTFYTWEPQPAIPWETTEGCYMDSDGNGVINNFDYIAIKLNWMKSHGTNSLKTIGITPSGINMLEAYPNPFNPATNIRYVISENSDVTLEIFNFEGKRIQVLVQESLMEGEYRMTFDGSTLSSGMYVVTIVVKGQESGIIFTESAKLYLTK